MVYYILYWWHRHFQVARNYTSMPCLILAHIIISQTRLQIQKYNGTKVQGNPFYIEMKKFYVYKMCLVKWIFLSENLKIFIYEKNHKKIKIWLKIWNQHKKEKYFRQISVSLQVRFMDKWHFCRKMGGNILILIFYVFHFYFSFPLKIWKRMWMFRGVPLQNLNLINSLHCSINLHKSEIFWVV